MKGNLDTIEGRKDSRHDFNEKVFIEILAATSINSQDQVVLECSTKDVSLNGLKIKSEHPLLLNSILELNLSFATSNKEFQLIGEVRWSRRIDNEHYESGFELLNAEHADMADWELFLAES